MALPVAEVVGDSGQCGQFVDNENHIAALGHAVEALDAALALMSVGDVAVVFSEESECLSAKIGGRAVVGVDVGHLSGGEEIVVKPEIAGYVDTVAAWHAGIALDAGHRLEVGDAAHLALRRVRGSRRGDGSRTGRPCSMVAVLSLGRESADSRGDSRTGEGSADGTEPSAARVSLIVF